MVARDDAAAVVSSTGPYLDPRGVAVRPSGGALGAEVDGVDVAAGLDEPVLQAVRDAVLRHSVVVLRDQHLTPDAQLAFTARLWPLRPPSALNVYAPPGHPQVTVISNVVEEGRRVGIDDAGLLWHSDLCFTTNPELFTTLHALEVPAREGRSLGDTLFVSTTAAYDALAEEQKRALEGLRAVQSYRFHLEKMAAQRLLTRPSLTDEQRTSVPDVDHPVVRVHPITGRRLLYVNESFSSHVLGLPAAESRALLDSLCAHLLRPELRYRHVWREGDLVVWDNCATQHHATFDYDGLRRRLHRCGTAGPVPV